MESDLAEGLVNGKLCRCRCCAEVKRNLIGEDAGSYIPRPSDRSIFNNMCDPSQF